MRPPWLSDCVAARPYPPATRVSADRELSSAVASTQRVVSHPVSSGQLVDACEVVGQRRPPIEESFADCRIADALRLRDNGDIGEREVGADHEARRALQLLYGAQQTLEIVGQLRRRLASDALRPRPLLEPFA